MAMDEDHCPVCGDWIRDCQCEECIACGTTVPAHRLLWDEETSIPLCPDCG